MKRFPVLNPLRILVAGALVVCTNVFGAENIQRLDSGWEFYQGSLGSTWEIWRGDKATDNVNWTPVTLPYCFNAPLTAPLVA